MKTTRRNKDVKHHTEPVLAFEVVDFDEMSPAEIDFAERFDANLIGQPDARQIALDVRARYKNPARDMNRPLGIYWLAGKSRRGKSLLAQVLAKLFHGDKEALTRLTAEDYSDRSDMHGLRGAPPRYASWREPVTDARKLPAEKLAQIDPYSVVTDWNRLRVRVNSRETIDIVVLEEFGKSGDDFYKFWMEVFDKGKKVLANGEVADFTNTVFILTDNTGMDQVEDEERGGIGFNAHARKLSHAEIVSVVNDNLRRKYKPEFRNRIDLVVVYRELTEDDVAQILGVELNHFEERILRQMPRGKDFTLDVTESARNFILADAKGEVADLKRSIQRHLEVPLGRMLDEDNENRVLGGDLVRITFEADSRAGKAGKLSFAIARGAGDVDANLEGLRMYTGETDASKNGLVMQRRVAKARMAARREKNKVWSLVLTGTEKDDFQESSAALINDLRRVYEIEIDSFSLKEKAPYAITIVVEATDEQIGLVKEMYPELTATAAPRPVITLKKK